MKSDESFHADSLYFIPKKPCKHGHSLRYAKSHHCIYCQRLATAIHWNKLPRSEEEIKADLALLLTEQLENQKARWGFI